MKHRLVNLDAVTAAIKPYLGQYLQEHGINTNKNFRCLDPKHTDSTASMTCKQYPEQAFCLGCSRVADIFTAAHFLEGKPIKGKDWIEKNVLYLAKKFGVTVELEDLTPEEIYEYRTYSAYELAAKLVSDPDFGDYTKIDKEIARRGWDKTKLAEWGVGTVNYDEFKDRLKKAGYEVNFLSGIGLEGSNLFNNNNLLFTVHDDEGKPVGFSAKNLRHKNDDKESGPKYINTRGTGLECAIFKKGHRLYGLEIAKEIMAPLHIFEGQADVITARHHGMMNCVCTLGTSLTDHHVNLLKKYGLFNIVLVFDSDTAGELAVEKALDDKFAKERDFRVKLCQLPLETDPDELIRTHGIDELVRLKRWSAFEWRMKGFMEETKESGDIDDDRRREIAEKMAPIIVSEPSHIRQEEMARQVARMTGFDLTTIVSEVKRLRNEKEAEIQTKKRNIIEALTSEVKYHPEEAEVALRQAQRAIDSVNKSLQDEEKTGSATLNMVLSQKEVDENKSDEFAGFFMKPWGLGGIGARLNDDWRKDCLMFVGGSEQSGKTSLICQMAYEIADDVRNNAICIYLSIDDSARFILYKWICNAANDMRLHLGHVSSPAYWMKQRKHEFVADLREKGYHKIINMVKDEKLILKDSSDGQDLVYAESLARYYRAKYPSKNIVLFIDSFHKLTDYANIQGWERAKRICNHLKTVTTSNHITTVSTAEYRKLNPGELPQNASLAESRSLMYDSDVIIHLCNDLHNEGPDKARLIHKDSKGNVLPRIWCKFGKNKVSGYEDREFLDLFGASAVLKAADKELAIKEQKERIEFLNESRPNMF